jgi:hypothetical protein
VSRTPVPAKLDSRLAASLSIVAGLLLLVIALVVAVS